MSEARPPYDFPAARALSAVEVAQLLTANRFAEARHAVWRWSPDNPVRRLIEAGLYQEAICEIERAAFRRGTPLCAYERLGDRNFAAMRRAA